jgi:chromate transporter
MTAKMGKVGQRFPPPPTFPAALHTFARIGILSFGGPAGQIALMHRELVDRHGWLSERQFLNALSFCMMLPGPEAMQLATYAGWRLHGVAGGLAAGLLFVAPGAVVVLALAMLYAAFGDLPLVEALFLGVKAAVVVIVVEALLRVSKRALNGAEHWAIAGLAFLAIFVLALPFPLIVAAAGAYGFLRPGPAVSDDGGTGARPAFTRAAATAALWLAVWWGPLLAIRFAAPGGILDDLGIFFSKLAVVTFGGAYAVLAYMAEVVVRTHGWLTPGEMLDGLGLAETTPGPLILVTEFVGFLAAERAGGLAFGLAGAAVTLWATFVPCFLWIFVGAPWIDWIATRPRLRGALTAITAAVVGVILNLSIWFALHVLFGEVNLVTLGPLRLWWPDPASVDIVAVGLCGLSAILLFRFDWNVLALLPAVAALGAAIVATTG